MIWLIIAIIVVAACFAGVILVGAPYLPTLSPQIKTAIELADLKPGQTMLELGCGDGRVVLAAAKAGVTVVGYELNPILILIAWLRTRPYKQNVKLVWGNFWHKEWPSTDVIFVFLLGKYMKKLDKKCVQYPHKPLILVSFAFKIANRTADNQQNGIYLYNYK